MKLVTYRRRYGPGQPGALVDDGTTIVDLRAAAFASLQELIEGGADALAHARDHAASDRAERIDRADVELLAPLPRPEQLRCFSTFEQHVRQSGQAMMKLMGRDVRFEVPPLFYERPLYYKGNRFSVVGDGAEITWPSYSNTIDFELEFAAVIGKRAKNVTAEEAGAHIFGYTVFNDLTARDEQSKEMVAPLGPAKGKDFDGGNVMGPCIVTADELPDPYALRMTARVNGEVWSDSNTGGMTHRFPQMIAYVARDETLHPGEVLLSGCAGGGCGMELGRYPQRGDTIELEIERIGKITNKVV